MNLYIATETNFFVESPTFPRPILGTSLKRRDTPLIRLGFLSGDQITSLPEDTSVVIGVKRKKDYTGQFLALATQWEQDEVSQLYSVTLSLNTENLNTAFVEANEPDFIEAMLEVQWASEEYVTSSVTLPLVINNDVIQDTESTPESMPDMKASQEEAEEGLNNTRWMTPLRTKEAIQALGGGGGISDAPSDGNLYGRKNAAWSEAASPSDLPSPLPTFVSGGTYGTQFVVGDIPEAWQDDEDIVNLYIGNSATIIGGQAFSQCFFLIGSIVIPNSVTTIGGEAFADCGSLTSLTIGNSVTTIGEYAFSNCGGLTGTLVIPSSVTSIGSNAFYGCSGFTGDLTIPITVTSIGGYAFRLMTGNDLIVNCTTISVNAFEGTAFNGNLIIGNSVTSIGNYAFNNGNGNFANFTSLTIGNSVTTIGNYAFYDGSFTGSLILPNSLTSIGSYAFQYCTDFTGSLAIPNSVTTIGSAAFKYCSGFDGTLTLGNSITSIGSGAFEYCQGFTGSLAIPNSVTTIGSGAFKHCSGFDGTLTLGNSVTSIGGYAFYSTTFTSTILATGRTTIPNNFAVISGLSGTLVIPDTVTSIGGDAFFDCVNLTGSLVIPNSVTSIGSRAFSYTSGLVNLVIPNSTTTLGVESFRFSGVTAAYLNQPIGQIGSDAFDYSGITNVYIGPDATGYTLGEEQTIGGKSDITVSEWTNYPNVP
jgi:hypothetical protein